jgi:hypothetical protein
MSTLPTLQGARRSLGGSGDAPAVDPEGSEDALYGLAIGLVATTYVLDDGGSRSCKPPRFGVAVIEEVLARH